MAASDYCHTCEGAHYPGRHQERERLKAELRRQRDYRDRLRAALSAAVLTSDEETGSDIAESLEDTEVEIAELEDALRPTSV